MKTKLKIPFLTVGLGSLVFLGFAGTISGSLAWWAYSTRATVSYQGTSVASSEQIQIGIKTSVNLSSLGMTQETIGGQSYYWCDAGAGLPAGIVNYYLAQEGTYASTELEPISSGSYSPGDSFQLKRPLVSGTRTYPSGNAETDKYVYLPLAFRILRYNGSNERTYATKENIWLSDTDVKASSEGDGNVYKAIRMYTVGQKVVENDGVKSFESSIHLINPSNKTDNGGQTAVAGLLDISGSGYYDTYEKNGRSYNIVYGESNLTEDQLLAVETQTSATDSGITDFNMTGMGTSELSTFTSKFYRNTYYPAALSNIQPKYQNFDTLKSVKPNDDNGALSGGAPLCATADNGVADLAITIWLEGWDHNVIDQENHHSFNLGLQFQISRL